MRTIKLFTLVLGIIVLTQASYAQKMLGSSHDFSARSWNTQNGVLTGEICIVCHTPHNAQVGVPPLWNHQMPTSNYTMYSNAVSGTFNGSTTQPDGSSKLCLTCHDGTISYANFGTNTAGTSNFSATDRRLIGTDLTNDHPVSFVYDGALATADGGLYDPAVQTTALGGTINHDMLEQGKLQCNSCHDIHNGNGLGSNNATGYAPILRISKFASALCLTCHKK
jgi:hypothetical protein